MMKLKCCTNRQKLCSQQQSNQHTINHREEVFDVKFQFRSGYLQMYACVFECMYLMVLLMTRELGDKGRDLETYFLFSMEFATLFFLRNILLIIVDVKFIVGFMLDLVSYSYWAKEDESIVYFFFE
eukprot:TRINITY_DN26282_c0_g1_i1.p3 TRINITY_DN26282_c0_g1~~TRINITY_DN26282_c0_g1_i1.p3  ORF type:complete len:126 (+),score=9.50 TRINITY_DN26282_c0_g1_i1:131-508(+)